MPVTAMRASSIYVSRSYRSSLKSRSGHCVRGSMGLGSRRDRAVKAVRREGSSQPRGGGSHNPQPMANVQEFTGIDSILHSDPCGLSMPARAARRARAA
eukprot:6332306-Prymnesium_polylepis.2